MKQTRNTIVDNAKSEISRVQIFTASRDKQLNS